ncbi:snake venom 5'-nucleotidase-like [Artemia franciscana]|uniref:5'-nucleotidase n=1 Tax=Artemia franciscana TaxID=6661 RepID=A0AA88HMP5_ARTSF|nr:hypothetical protein QYM36_014113 [Artemia franciscana]
MLLGKLAFLLFLTIVSCQEDFVLNVVHVNDIHAHFDPFNKNGLMCSTAEEEAKACYGGLPRLMTKVKELLDRNNTLFLNAGDFYQGTLYYSLFKGDLIAKMGNLMHMTAFALGNHEFDDGVPGLMNMTLQAEFPVLGANIDTALEPELAKTIDKSVIVEVGGRRIGIIGFITKNTDILASPGENLVFLDEIESLQEEADRLTEDGVDIIIAVGHSGYEEDKAIAANVKGVDLVVGAHSHSFLWPDGMELPAEDQPRGPYPTIVTQSDGEVTRKVPVVQAYAYGKYVGNFSLRFNSMGDVLGFEGLPILIDQSIEPDQTIIDALKPYYDAVQQDYFYYIGKTNVYLNGSGRLEETNMGNLITDAMIDWVSNEDTVGMYNSDYEWTKAAIAVNNDGSIRASIDDTSRDGNITRGDIRSVVPFENELWIIEVNGKTLKEAIELSVKEPSGAFLQVSGLQLFIDKNLPPGARTVQMYARCQKCRVPAYEPVEDNKNYRIAIFDFLAEGGDGYYMFKNKTVEMLGVKDYDVVEGYISKISPVNIGVEGRIRFIDSDRSSSQSLLPISLILVFSTAFCLFI